MGSRKSSSNWTKDKSNVLSSQLLDTMYVKSFPAFPRTLKGCVMHNDPWPWLISSSSCSHDLAIKILNVWHLVVFYSTYSCGWILSVFDKTITSISVCVACDDLWPWPASLRSFSHEFAIKLLWYGTSSQVRSTALTVLNGLFPYLALSRADRSMFCSCGGGTIVDHWSTISIHQWLARP